MGENSYQCLCNDNRILYVYIETYMETIVVSLVVTVGVFGVCSILDAMQIRFIERPFFCWLDRKSERISTWIKNCLLVVKLCLNRIGKVLE